MYLKMVHNRNSKCVYKKDTPITFIDKCNGSVFLNYKVGSLLNAFSISSSVGM